MNNPNPIDKRALARGIASLLIVLGLATWGGIKMGGSSAAYSVQAQQKDNEALRTQLDQIQADLSQSQSRFDALQQSSAALRTQLGLADTELSKAQSQYGSLQSSNAALQTQLASAQAQLSQMQSQYSSLQGSNAALQTQLASAQAQLSQMQSQYGSLQQDNAALRAQSASAQQTITALQAQLQAWDTWSRSAPRSTPTTSSTGPNLTLNSTSGAAGTTITIIGSGFAANTYGGVFFDINRNGTYDSGEPIQYLTTSSVGTFSTALIVPQVPPTAYPVTADFPVGPPSEASATFTVTT